jgi:FRG domain
MEGKEVAHWEDFQEQLQEIKKSLGPQAGPLLYRGQADCGWQLTTTLERAGCERMPFSEYWLRFDRVRPAIETFTGVSWDLPDYGLELQRAFRDYEEFSRFPSPPVYRFMIYLRHHGFPSPLLDWSYSAAVAAFFAFRDDLRTEKRSVFVFCETPEGYKTWGSRRPSIRRIGPYVRGHPRHFRQQSDYTICGNFDVNQGWCFHSHEEVFNTRRVGQDFLWKFNFPSSLRVAVLRQLNEYNLNAFSLFESEEALLETMWLKEHVLRERA